MSGVTTAFYDRIMAGTEQACLAEWRRTLVGPVVGEVLEIGAGTGANIAYYASDVTTVTLVEPDVGMRRQLDAKLALRGDDRMRTADHAAEHLPYADAAFDAVVCTLVLCSVSDPDRVLEEVFRVLKPGGTFVFIEHVAAEAGTPRRKWQGRIEPLWVWFTGNCHLTRTSARTIEAAGLSITSLTRESLRKAVPWVRPSIRGTAEKPRL